MAARMCQGVEIAKNTSVLDTIRSFSKWRRFPVKSRYSPMAPTGKTNPIRPLVNTFSAQTAATVTAMLVNSAQVSEAEMNLLPGYTIAAKTGTSTPDPQNASVTYASVLGYAPATNPRFVLLVKLDHPKTDIFGGSAAGPLWRALASKLFTYYQIAPDAA